MRAVKKGISEVEVLSIVAAAGCVSVMQITGIVGGRFLKLMQ